MLTAVAPTVWPKARYAVIAAGVLTVALGGTLLFGQWRKSTLDGFWGPMLDTPGGVLISLAQPRVYNFRSDARQRQIETIIQGMSPAEFASTQEVTH